jgi:hypothetical protein
MLLTYGTQPIAHHDVCEKGNTACAEVVLTTSSNEASLNQDHTNHQVTSTSPSTRDATCNMGENRMMVGIRATVRRHIRYSSTYNLTTSFLQGPRIRRSGTSTGVKQRATLSMS